MYWLNPLQEDHKRRIIRTSHQGTTASTFKETNLDRLPPLSNMPYLYTFTTNIHTHQSSSGIQYILPYFKRLVIEDEGRNWQENEWTKPLWRQLLQCLGFETLETQSSSTLPICFLVLRESQKTGLWPMAYTLHLLWENLNRDIVPPWDYKQVCRTSSVPGEYLMWKSQ